MNFLTPGGPNLRRISTTGSARG